MGRCRAETKGGKRCRRPTMRDSHYCVSHRHLQRKKNGQPAPQAEGGPDLDATPPSPPTTIAECQRQQAEVLADLRCGRITATAASVLLSGLRGLMKTLPDDGGREDDLSDEQLAAALRQQLGVVEGRLAARGKLDRPDVSAAVPAVGSCGAEPDADPDAEAAGVQEVTG